MLGAFGAHALTDTLSPAGLGVWETAVRYHLIHALALVLVGVLETDHREPALAIAGWAFLAGVVFFSGSLYLLAAGGPRVLGPVTPFGGLGFIVGWSALGWAGLGRRGR
jgi:uncharacterized membrane protein YgdD (TMEM256/DUF423 family)